MLHRHALPATSEPVRLTEPEPECGPDDAA
ncbi:hypothetical protein FHR32_007060, partial [Streptosporangium album]|nr:hypothetical protein [Streptosporangium album]